LFTKLNAFGFSCGNHLVAGFQYPIFNLQFSIFNF